MLADSMLDARLAELVDIACAKVQRGRGGRGEKYSSHNYYSTQTRQKVGQALDAKAIIC